MRHMIKGSVAMKSTEYKEHMSGGSHYMQDGSYMTEGQGGGSKKRSTGHGFGKKKKKDNPGHGGY